MAFVLFIEKKPKSINAGGRHLKNYKTKITQVAKKAQPSKWLNEELYIRISYFHAEPATIDVDNMSKPIVDSLRGIVYHDDSQILLRLASKIDITKANLIYEEWEQTNIDELDELLDNQDHFICIEVGELNSVEFHVGVPQ